MRFFSFTFIFVMAVAFIVTTGCTISNNHTTDIVNSDSIGIDTTADSLSRMVEEEPMPVAADELFDDFFFNFAASRKVQKERTTFPLVQKNLGKVTRIDKDNWQTEHFFMSQGYYTLLFSKKSELNIMKDTSINEVTVGRISFERETVKRWHFVRTNGLWHLHDIVVIPLSQHADHDFLSFYNKFSTDKEFQQLSLAESVSFSGPDPDDDFSTMTGDILPEQWPMFAPWMPTGTIYNIIYGKPVTPAASTRYFLIRGIANGLQTDLTFVKQGNRWVLKKIST